MSAFDDYAMSIDTNTKTKNYTCYNVVMNTNNKYHVTNEVTDSTTIDTDLVYTIGKMNPATTGHRNLITQMFEYSAIHGNIPIYIGLTNTSKNCNGFKKALVELMCESIQRTNLKFVNIKYFVSCPKLETNDVFGLVNSIMKSTQSINATLFLGSDRIDVKTDKTDKTDVTFFGRRNLKYACAVTRHANGPNGIKINEKFTFKYPAAGMSSTLIKGLLIDDKDSFIKEMTQKKKVNNVYVYKVYSIYDAGADATYIKNLYTNKQAVFDKLMKDAIIGTNKDDDLNSMYETTIHPFITYGEEATETDEALAKKKEEEEAKKAQPDAKKAKKAQPDAKKAKKAKTEEEEEEKMKEEEKTQEEKMKEEEKTQEEKTLAAIAEAKEFTNSLKKGVGGKKTRITKRHLKKTPKRKTRVSSRK